MSQNFSVLAKRRIPTKLPIIETVVAVLVTDVYDLDSWGLGSIVAFIVLLWVVRIGMRINERPIDPFIS